MTTFCQGLDVTIHDARSLRSTQTLGTQDPYTTVQFNAGQKFKTRTHTDGGKVGVWNQNFTFQVSQISEQDFLLVRVFNKNALSDDKIGGVRIDLSAVVRNNGHIDQYFQLYKERMGKGKDLR